jgi:hypothetical protein
MLIFFDETFRPSLKHPQVTLGALCGIGIPERELGRVADDVFKLKLKHMGADFARNDEIKGKELLKEWVFRLEARGTPSKNLALARDLVEYVVRRRFPVFGCVCFERDLQAFKVEDVRALDRTFRYLFERIDLYMKFKRRDDTASLVFDDRDYGVNRRNAEAITNYFQLSANGLALDSIVKTPFFAISQANNVGLQLADFVTTIVGMRFASQTSIAPFFVTLKQSMITLPSDNQHTMSMLKVMRGRWGKKKAPGSL